MRSIAFAVLGMAISPVLGQGLTVQQPAFETFSAATTMSVPAGGSVGVGSVGRMRAGQVVVGPYAGQRGLARSGSAGSISATATIHDLETLDAAVLGAAGGTAARPAFTKSRYRDATSYAMSRRWEAVARYDAAIAQTGKAEQREQRPTPHVVDPRRALALGTAAEERGQVGLARLHYQSAAKWGSAEAEQRLAHVQAIGAGQVE